MKSVGKDFEEIISILADFPIIKIASGGFDNCCSVCGRENKAVVSVSFEPDADHMEICFSCSLKVMTRRMFLDSWHVVKDGYAPHVSFNVDEYLANRDGEKKPKAKGFSFDPPEFSLDSDKEFIEKLRVSSPRFARCLSGFLAGDVRMEDGSEHELLQSIASQVLTRRKMPTKKQELAFVSVYTGLLSKRAAGVTLKKESDEDKKKRAAVAGKLIAIGMKHLKKWPGAKTREIISSMATQYQNKGTLSEKQIDYLRWIIEQMPEHLLTE